MTKVCIFVVSHKHGPKYTEGVYVPIHVGRAISIYKTEMTGMIGDDMGENISEKNPSYCEMTAHYWIWKNVMDAEFVGPVKYKNTERRSLIIPPSSWT